MIVRMILLQHCLNAEPPGEEKRYYPVFCDMCTGNWGHGKTQAVPTVSSYTVSQVSCTCCCNLAMVVSGSGEI